MHCVFCCVREPPWLVQVLLYQISILETGYSFFHQILTECLGIVWGAGDTSLKKLGKSCALMSVHPYGGRQKNKNKSDSILLIVLSPVLSHVCSAPFVKERGLHPEMYRIVYSQGSDL